MSRTLIGLALVVLLAGCQEDVHVIAFCPAESMTCREEAIPVVEQMIGPDGGVVRLAEGVELHIPPGALSEPVQIRLRGLHPDHLESPAGTFSEEEEGIRPTEELRALGGVFLEPGGLTLAHPALLVLPVARREQQSPAVVGVMLDYVPEDPLDRRRWSRWVALPEGRALLGEVVGDELHALVDRFPLGGRALGLAEPRLVPVDVYPTTDAGLCAGLDFIATAVEEAEPTLPDAARWPAICAERPADCLAAQRLVDPSARDPWLAETITRLARTPAVDAARTPSALQAALLDGLRFWWGLGPADADDPERTCAEPRPGANGQSWKRETWCALRALDPAAAQPRGPAAAMDPLDRWLAVAWMIDRAERRVRLRRTAALLNERVYPADAQTRLVGVLDDPAAWLDHLVPPPSGRWSGRWAAALPGTMTAARTRAGFDAGALAARLSPASPRVPAGRQVRCRLAAIAAIPPDVVGAADRRAGDPDADRLRAEVVAIARSALRATFLESERQRVTALAQAQGQGGREGRLLDWWRADVRARTEAATAILVARFCCAGGLDEERPDLMIGPETVDCPAPVDLRPDRAVVPVDADPSLSVSWMQPACRFSRVVGFEVQAAPDDGVPLAQQCTGSARCTIWRAEVGVGEAEERDGRYAWRPSERAEALWPTLDGVGHRWRVRARSASSFDHPWSDDARLFAPRTALPIDDICAAAARDTCGDDRTCTPPPACADDRLARCDLPIPRVEDCPAGARCRVDDFGEARCAPEDEVLPPLDGLGHALADGGPDLDPDGRVVRLACVPGEPVLAVVDGVVEPSAPGERCVRDATRIVYCIDGLAGDPLSVGCEVERGMIIAVCGADGAIEVRARGEAPGPFGEPPADADAPRPLPPLERWSPAPAIPRPARCPPEPEVCDGLDNDGDGAIDERTGGGPLLQACPPTCGVPAALCAAGGFPGGDALRDACRCPPDNDRCLDATRLAQPGALGVGSGPIRVMVEGTTRHARDDEQPRAPGCGVGDGGDVVYRFDLDVTARVALSVEGEGWLPRPWLRRARCGAPAAACADLPGERLDVELPPGTYELVVDGDGPGEGGFVVEAYFEPVGCDPGQPLVDEDGALVPCEPPMAEVGVCRAGVQYCAADGRSRVCVGRVRPTWPDVDDGLDNDCDGAVDEDVPPPLNVDPPDPPLDDRDCADLQAAGRCNPQCPCPAGELCAGGQCLPDDMGPPICDCPPGTACDGGECVETVECNGVTCGRVGAMICGCGGNDRCIRGVCCDPTASARCEGGASVFTDSCGNELGREECFDQCNLGYCDIIIPPRASELYYCNDAHPRDAETEPPLPIYSERVNACGWSQRLDERAWFGFYDITGGGGFWTWGGDCPGPNYDEYVSHNARWHFTLRGTGRYELLARVPDANAGCADEAQYSNFEYAIFQNDSGVGQPVQTARFDQAAHPGGEGRVLTFDGVEGQTYTVVVYDQHPNGAECIQCGEQNRLVRPGDVKLYIGALRVRRIPQ